MRSSKNGLSDQEAKKRIKQFGLNTISSTNERKLILLFLAKLANPLVISLTIIAIISFSLGERLNSIIIILMALLSTILSFIQENHASRSAEKLNEMVKITAEVIRNGHKLNLPLKEIVPGDIIELSAGKLIPADMKIISSDNLYINQATINGESFPVLKSAQIPEKKPDSIYYIENLAFMGSSVTSGFGQALVLRTGKQTELGKLSEDVTKMEKKTSFEKGVEKFTWLLVEFTFVLVIIIFIINAVFKTNIIESLLFALAIAITLAPEMLPMIVTINLSKGALLMAKKKVVVKVLPSIQNFGAMDILCVDKTGTLTINNIVLIKHCDINGEENDNILRMAYINSHFQSGLENLLDTAIINHKKYDINNVKKIYEIPFDFERKIMSVVVKEKNKYLLIAKGAPEEIIKRCQSYVLSEKVSRLSNTIKKKIDQIYDTYSKDGFRVLTIAYKNLESKTKFTDEDENGLTFLGFAAFLDPPKASAKEAIDQLNNYGINLKVLSGDNEFVTEKICKEVDIDINGILHGKDISKMSDFQLAEIVQKTSVFARLDPDQKKRVVRALQKDGHTVGFLGDGINDAPALRAADVGISVDNATDIAKGTAEIILLEKDLSILSNCVIEGRRIFTNILKYIKVGASSNLGNSLSLVGASIFLKFLPALPAQLILNDFLYDVSQIFISTDNVDDEDIKKPLPWDINYIKKFMLFFGPLTSIFDFLTFGVMLYIFHSSPELFRTGWFVESLIAQIFLIFVVRTNKIPFIQSKPSKTLLWSTILVSIFALFICYSPLARFFDFVPMTITFFAFIVLLIIINLSATQLAKQWFFKKYGYK